MTVLPPASVLVAFGLSGDPEPLPGGEGRAVRVGRAVLKPVDGREEAEWCAGLFDRLPPSVSFRVPRPIKADSGTYVVDGWTASELVPGRPCPDGRWASLLAVGRAFHEALRAVPRPDLLDRRAHPWAIADRVAWQEEDVTLRGDAAPLLAALRPLLTPVAAPAQLVHGDLTGNVLFHRGSPPAVIDFSPYWRPAGYAEAIVVADALLHHGAGPDLVDALGEEGPELLARALVFRLVALALLVEKPTPDDLAPFAAITRLARSRL
ncbi:TIGR02569 family protein [Nonomuraea sp. NPDC048826]|uniref:TIGR02569 family protein n=1 Tax=Nonomuraea sp. NPDC048826 TaxID=3364347 RepID=UPI0037241149